MDEPGKPAILHGGVRKIAVVRANGLGDLIFAAPAVAALRARFPQAEIVWLGKALHRALLSGRPGPVDRVVVIPPYKGVSEPDTYVERTNDRAASEAFFEAMAAERFDLAIQMHGGGGYSNPFTRRLGARTTLGLRAPGAEPLDLNLPYIYFQSEVMRYLELVALVGATICDVAPHLAVLPSDLAESRGALPDDDTSQRPLVVIHPGATDARRRWPPERFAAVADVLVAACGARVALCGDESERPLTHAITQAMRADATDTAGRLSLGGLVGLLARADLVLANDSGPCHLAEAVGARTVGVYWFPNEINGAPLTRARHRQAISWRQTCPVCGHALLGVDCEHRASVVSDVTTDEVTAAALSLLGDWRAEPGGATRNTRREVTRDTASAALT